MKKFFLFTVVIALGSGAALATNLRVPFFLDNVNQGVEGFIGVKSDIDQVLTVVYTTVNASNTVTNQTVTFAIGAGRAIDWQPVQDTATENRGSLVPNMTIVGGNGVKKSGSASIQSDTPDSISGRYRENRGNQQYSYVLLPFTGL